MLQPSLFFQLYSTVTPQWGICGHHMRTPQTRNKVPGDQECSAEMGKYNAVNDQTNWLCQEKILFLQTLGLTFNDHLNASGTDSTTFPQTFFFILTAWQSCYRFVGWKWTCHSTTTQSSLLNWDAVTSEQKSRLITSDNIFLVSCCPMLVSLCKLMGAQRKIQELISVTMTPSVSTTALGLKPRVGLLRVWQNQTIEFHPTIFLSLYRTRSQGAVA